MQDVLSIVLDGKFLRLLDVQHSYHSLGFAYSHIHS